MAVLRLVLQQNKQDNFIINEDKMTYQMLSDSWDIQPYL